MLFPKVVRFDSLLWTKRTRGLPNSPFHQFHSHFYNIIPPYLCRAIFILVSHEFSWHPLTQMFVKYSTPIYTIKSWVEINKKFSFWVLQTGVTLKCSNKSSIVDYTFLNLAWNWIVQYNIYLLPSRCWFCIFITLSLSAHISSKVGPTAQTCLLEDNERVTFKMVRGRQSKAGR